MPSKNETQEAKPTLLQLATTNWGAFERASLVPTEVLCQAYHPVHQVDMSCHTKIVPTAKNMIAHLDGDHGGAFRVVLKRVENKTWEGWKDLKEAGIECFDLRCDVCDKNIPLHPQHLMQHMKAHQGKNRRIQNGGTIWLTIGRGSVAPQGDDAYAELD